MDKIICIRKEKLLMWLTYAKKKVVCRACNCEFSCADEYSEGRPITCITCGEESMLTEKDGQLVLEPHEE